MMCSLGILVGARIVKQTLGFLLIGYASSVSQPFTRVQTDQVSDANPMNSALTELNSRFSVCKGPR